MERHVLSWCSGIQGSFSTSRRRLLGAAATAFAAYAFWRLHQGRRIRRGPDQEPANEAEDFRALAPRVAALSGGRLRLINTADRGRCLVAATALPAGTQICDRPVVPHGTDRGAHLAGAVAPDLKQAARFASPDLLVALDFLASLVRALADGACEGKGGRLAWLWPFGRPVAHEAHLLKFLYAFEGKVEQVPMIRLWHSRWVPELASLPVERVEAAWSHVVPNWRRLVSAVPKGEWVRGPDGPEMSLGHTTVCGLWLLMALCEHSCDPSCVLVHDGRDLRITTLRPLLPGEAITTSYLNIQGLQRPVEQRQRQLTEWGFKCACSRCIAELQREPGPAAQEQSESEMEALFDLWRRPPGEAEEERSGYCESLARLGDLARRVHGGAADPTTQSQLLLSALFAAGGRERACRDLVRACEGLAGDSHASAWARTLADDAEGCLRQATAEARAAMLLDGCDRDTAERLADELSGADPRASLRAMYRRGLLARRWPRLRARPSGRYVAAASAA